MGIKPNSNNEPDIYGYEQKKDSKKITYGDWQATCYLFNNNKKRPECMSDEILSRKDFIKIFGSPNPKKRIDIHGRVVVFQNMAMSGIRMVKDLFLMIIIIY